MRNNCERIQALRGEITALGFLLEAAGVGAGSINSSVGGTLAVGGLALIGIAREMVPRYISSRQERLGLTEITVSDGDVPALEVAAFECDPLGTNAASLPQSGDAMG